MAKIEKKSSAPTQLLQMSTGSTTERKKISLDLKKDKLLLGLKIQCLLLEALEHVRKLVRM